MVVGNDSDGGYSITSNTDGGMASSIADQMNALEEDGVQSFFVGGENAGIGGEQSLEADAEAMLQRYALSVPSPSDGGLSAAIIAGAVAVVVAVVGLLAGGGN